MFTEVIVLQYQFFFTSVTPGVQRQLYLAIIQYLKQRALQDFSSGGVWRGSRWGWGAGALTCYSALNWYDSLQNIFPAFILDSFLIVFIYSTWSIDKKEDTWSESKFLKVSVHKKENTVLLFFFYPSFFILLHWIKSKLVLHILLEAKWIWGKIWEKS